MSSEAPGGLSWSAFEATAIDAGTWLWGTVQGAFNEKSSLSQIIVDAVIGMIPLVGDVTAARDLVAVSVGLIDEPKKRDDTWQWVLLAVLVFALIPVVGGVIKGVGRLVIKSAAEAAQLSGQAGRSAHLAASAKDIIAFLNKVGVGNAEKWLLKLRFADHQTQILERLNGFTVTVNRSLKLIQDKLGSHLPANLVRRVEALRNGFSQLAQKADEMVPRAVKELDQKLREIQQIVRSGGETTSRTIEHVAASGERATASYADELRLLEERAGSLRSARGGWIQNVATTSPQDAAAITKVYKFQSGFPDLLQRVDHPRGAAIGTYTNITTYAGKITNRTLHEGEEVFRVFGPEGVTHGFKVGGSFPTGKGPKFWGMGPAPKTAREWRERSGVLDEWNHDTFLVVGRVASPDKVKACTGKIAEQVGKDIPGQHLPGGAQQAMFEMSEDGIKKLSQAGKEATTSATPIKLTVDGIDFTVMPTGWKDANGVWGYLHMPGTATVQTARLGAREQASKEERAGTAGAASR